MSDQLTMQNTAQDGISAAIGKLMEHPELISMVASTLGQSSNSVPKAAQVSNTPQQSDTEVQTQPPDALASLIPMLSKMSGAMSKDGIKDVPHAQLLCALKPYVSESRQSAIDYILKISQMSSIMGALK